MTVFFLVLEGIDEKGGKERNMSCFLNTWDTASVHKHTLNITILKVPKERKPPKLVRFSQKKI